MTIQVNRQDPRVKRTRQYLKQAFYDLMLTQDFENLTIRQITDTAGVNRATFYHHFQDKYDLLDEAIEERFHEEMARWVDFHSEWNEQNLRNLLLGVCHWQAQFRPTCINRAITSAYHIEAKVKQLLSEILFSRLRKTNLVDLGKQESEIIVTMLSWSIYGIAQQWVNTGRSEEAESLADDAIPLMMRNISQEKS